MWCVCVCVVKNTTLYMVQQQGLEQGGRGMHSVGRTWEMCIWGGGMGVCVLGGGDCDTCTTTRAATAHQQ
jgi:hypothetical protein